MEQEATCLKIWLLFMFVNCVTCTFKRKERGNASFALNLNWQIGGYSHDIIIPYLLCTITNAHACSCGHMFACVQEDVTFSSDNEETVVQVMYSCSSPLCTHCSHFHDFTIDYVFELFYQSITQEYQTHHQDLGAWQRKENALVLPEVHHTTCRTFS